MRFALIGLSALASAFLFVPTPGNAQYWQGKGTWCIQPPVGGGIWDCSYYNRWQCEQSASGRSGGCVPSPAAEWDRREGKVKGKSRVNQPGW